VGAATGVFEVNRKEGHGRALTTCNFTSGGRTFLVLVCLCVWVDSRVTRFQQESLDIISWSLKKSNLQPSWLNMVAKKIKTPGYLSDERLGWVLLEVSCLMHPNYFDAVIPSFFLAFLANPAHTTFTVLRIR